MRKVPSEHSTKKSPGFPGASIVEAMLDNFNRASGHTRSAQFTFISTELSTWQTLTSLAEGADEAQPKAARYREKARLAYDSVWHFVGRLNLTQEQIQKIDVQLASLKVLAEMIGTTRSRVNFFMNRFRELGFIHYNGGLRVHSSLLNVILHE